LTSELPRRALPALLLLGACSTVKTEGGVEARFTLRADVPDGVEAAALGLRRGEILPCSVASAGGLIGAAHADHSHTSPTTFDLHGEVDLLAASPQALATLAPPAGGWCALRLTVEPDGDGPSALIRGAPAGGAVVEAQSNSTAFIDLSVDPAVDLDADHPSHTFSLAVDLAPWVAALSTPNEPEGARSEALFAAARASVSLD
jgi:hypothetical protein